VAGYGQEAPPAPTDGRTPGEFHRALENARTNFGRSLLTPREFDVLQHILLGHSVKLIAQKLDIAVETVKVHRKHIIPSSASGRRPKCSRCSSRPSARPTLPSGATR
jgi:DNA-binding CsgD family transcriptional regulator